VVKDGKNVFFTGSAGSLFRPNWLPETHDW
jgi:hypothetical protein